MQEQFTVRIYDVELVNKIKDLEKQLRNIYHSKRNPFLVDCIIKGMEVIERDRLGIKNPKDLKELYDEVHKTFEKLTELMRLCEVTSKECMANITINQKLLTNNSICFLVCLKKHQLIEKVLKKGFMKNCQIDLKKCLKVF